MRNFTIVIFHALLVLFSIVGFNSTTENEMKCKENLSSNQLEGSIPSFLLHAGALNLSNNKFSDLASFLCRKILERCLLKILECSDDISSFL
ncbi:hypothetical protein P8452_04680 [Trifolium repens]|nr:hypothetical protein P8452_04680 [Trifolium repens]